MEVHNEAPSIGDKVVSTEDDISDTENRGVYEKKFKCWRCNVAFPSKYLLHHHIAYMHKGETMETVAREMGGYQTEPLALNLKIPNKPDSPLPTKRTTSSPYVKSSLKEQENLALDLSTSQPLTAPLDLSTVKIPTNFKHEAPFIKGGNTVSQDVGESHEYNFTRGSLPGYNMQGNMLPGISNVVTQGVVSPLVNSESGNFWPAAGRHSNPESGSGWPASQRPIPFPYDIEQMKALSNVKQSKARPGKTTTTKRKSRLKAASSEPIQDKNAVLEIYECKVCDRKFTQVGNFHNHMKIHTGKTCVCGICKCEFVDSYELQRHMRKAHTGDMPYKCEQCDREFSQYNNLRRHLRVHSGNNYKCHICGRTFNEVFYLEMHVGSHTGERTYSCGVCNLSFMDNAKLQKHVQTHNASELHTCEVCGKSFSKACVLRQHKKMHSGLRPFKCDDCGKSFIHRHHLKIHSRMHSTDKPYTCKICGKDFLQTSHLYKHIRQHGESGIDISRLQEELAEQLSRESKKSSKAPKNTTPQLSHDSNIEKQLLSDKNELPELSEDKRRKSSVILSPEPSGNTHNINLPATLSDKSRAPELNSSSKSDNILMENISVEDARGIQTGQEQHDTQIKQEHSSPKPDVKTKIKAAFAFLDQVMADRSTVKLGNDTDSEHSKSMEELKNLYQNNNLEQMSNICMDQQRNQIIERNSSLQGQGRDITETQFQTLHIKNDSALNDQLRVSNQYNNQVQVTTQETNKNLIDRKEVHANLAYTNVKDTSEVKDTSNVQYHKHVENAHLTQEKDAHLLSKCESMSGSDMPSDHSDLRSYSDTRRQHEYDSDTNSQKSEATLSGYYTDSQRSDTDAKSHMSLESVEQHKYTASQYSDITDVKCHVGSQLTNTDRSNLQDSCSKPYTLAYLSEVSEDVDEDVDIDNEDEMRLTIVEEVPKNITELSNLPVNQGQGEGMSLHITQKEKEIGIKEQVTRQELSPIVCNSDQYYHDNSVLCEGDKIKAPNFLRMADYVRSESPQNDRCLSDGQSVDFSANVRSDVEYCGSQNSSHLAARLSRGDAVTSPAFDPTSPSNSIEYTSLETTSVKRSRLPENGNVRQSVSSSQGNIDTSKYLDTQNDTISTTLLKENVSLEKSHINDHESLMSQKTQENRKLGQTNSDVSNGHMSPGLQIKQERDTYQYGTVNPHSVSTINDIHNGQSCYPHSINMPRDSYYRQSSNERQSGYHGDHNKTADIGTKSYNDSTMTVRNGDIDTHSYHRNLSHSVVSSAPPAIRNNDSSIDNTDVITDTMKRYNPDQTNAHTHDMSHKRFKMEESDPGETIVSSSTEEIHERTDTEKQKQWEVTQKRRETTPREMVDSLSTPTKTVPGADKYPVHDSRYPPYQQSYPPFMPGLGIDPQQMYLLQLHQMQMALAASMTTAPFYPGNRAVPPEHMYQAGWNPDFMKNMYSGFHGNVPMNPINFGTSPMSRSHSKEIPRDPSEAVHSNKNLVKDVKIESVVSTDSPY